MSEKWTEFQGGPSRRGKDEARVTLNNRGVLLLNRHAYEALGSPAAVKLFYEEDQRKIGLQPHDPRHSNAFPVKQKDKYLNRTIQITSFVRHWEVDVRRTVLFNEIDIDREGMMRLELNRTQTIGKAGK